MKFLTAEKAMCDNNKHSVVVVLFVCFPGIVLRNLTTLTHLTLTVPHQVDAVIDFLI